MADQTRGEGREEAELPSSPPQQQLPTESPIITEFKQIYASWVQHWPEIAQALAFIPTQDAAICLATTQYMEFISAKIVQNTYTDTDLLELEQKLPTLNNNLTISLAYVGTVWGQQNFPLEPAPVIAPEVVAVEALIPPQEAAVLEEILNIAKYMRDTTNDAPTILAMENIPAENASGATIPLLYWQETPLSKTTNKLLTLMQKGKIPLEADAITKKFKKLLFKWQKKVAKESKEPRILTDLLISSPDAPEKIIKLLAKNKHASVEILNTLVAHSNITLKILALIAKHPNAINDPELQLAIKNRQQQLEATTAAAVESDAPAALPTLQDRAQLQIELTTLDSTTSSSSNSTSQSSTLSPSSNSHNSTSSSSRSAIPSKHNSHHRNSTAYSSPNTSSTSYTDNTNKIIATSWNSVIKSSKANKNKKHYKINKLKNSITYQLKDQTTITASKTANQITIQTAKAATPAGISEVTRLAQAAIKAVPINTKSKLTINSGDFKDILTLLNELLTINPNIVIACTTQYYKQLQEAVTTRDDKDAKALLAKLSPSSLLRTSQLSQPLAELPAAAAGNPITHQLGRLNSSSSLSSTTAIPSETTPPSNPTLPPSTDTSPQ